MLVYASIVTGNAKQPRQAERRTYHALVIWNPQGGVWHRSLRGRIHRAIDVRIRQRNSNDKFAKIYADQLVQPDGWYAGVPSCSRLAIAPARLFGASGTERSIFCQLSRRRNTRSICSSRISGDRFA
jgi:hypothetical protein